MEHGARGRGCWRASGQPGGMLQRLAHLVQHVAAGQMLYRARGIVYDLPSSLLLFLPPVGGKH